MNAITIEQTSEQARLAFEVHQNCAIAGMRLLKSKLSTVPPEQLPESALSIKFTFRSKQNPAGAERIRLEVSFRMTGTEESGEEEELKRPETPISVECTYEVEYEVREGFEATAEHVKAFKDGNAIFNAWPYFREYLQSSMQRMGLPPLVAPFLRLQPKIARKKTQRPVGNDSETTPQPEAPPE